MQILETTALRGPNPPHLVCPECKGVVEHNWTNPMLAMLARKGQYHGETTGGLALCSYCYEKIRGSHDAPQAPPQIADCPAAFKDATLENYRVDAENRKVVERSRLWLDCEGRDLLIFGPPGTGKTRLAVSLARAKRVTATFMRVPALMRKIKDGFAGDGYELEPLVRVPLLILDDLGAEKPTPFTMQTVEGLYAERLDAGKRTIFTSNLPIASVMGRYARTLADQLDDARFLSRLVGHADMLELVGADRRLR